MLWWVDSEAGVVFRGTVDGDVVTVVERREVGEKVGSVAPAVDGGLLVAGERHVHVVDPTGAVVDRIRVIDDAVHSRLNDSACDPRGRFLVGSIRLDGRSRQETLVSIDADRVVRVVAEGITVSNGIGFSPEGTTMYYVDSRPGEVLAYDYDLDTGSASGRRLVFESGGTPDGLAVDVHGNLWIAFFREALVRCLSPSGGILQEIEVPVAHPTCPEFVGCAAGPARHHDGAAEDDRPRAGGITGFGRDPPRRSGGAWPARHRVGGLDPGLGRIRQRDRVHHVVGRARTAGRADHEELVRSP